MSRCGSCTDTPGCRFCLTTFKCMEGTDLEPTGDEDSTCNEWASGPSSCPNLNDCRYTSCDTCSQHMGCAWCGSLDRCMDDSDTNFVHCQGKVRPGEICPYPFASVTHVEGNLVIRGDAEVGGGVLHVSGPCNMKEDCNSEGFHSLLLDGTLVKHSHSHLYLDPSSRRFDSQEDASTLNQVVSLRSLQPIPTVLTSQRLKFCCSPVQAPTQLEDLVAIFLHSRVMLREASFTPAN